jgi:hypothetical protein
MLERLKAQAPIIICAAATSLLTCVLCVGGFLLIHYHINPNPQPPAPVDAFQDDLAKAFKSDQDADKSTSLGQLASLYRVAASSYVNRPELKNLGDVQNLMHSAAQGLIGDKMTAERQVIAAKLVSLLGEDDKALTDDLRKRVGDAFQMVSDALGKLK